MYQSFAAIIHKGKIKPMEKVNLKNNMKLVVTIVDDIEQTDFDALKKWVRSEKKAKRVTAYTSLDTAKKHLHALAKS